MKLKNLTQDSNRGVSPVIGVILMVAITVILAAVIGTMVLGLTDGVGQTAPTVSTTVTDASHDYDDTTAEAADAFVITHDNGEELDMVDLKVVVRDDSNAAMYTFEEASWIDIGNGPANLIINGKEAAASDADETFGVGDTIEIQVEDSSLGDLATDGDYTIQVVHIPSDSTVAESTVTLR